MPKTLSRGAELLRSYLQSLESKSEREAFAQRCGTSYNLMKQIAGGFRPAGESLAINIDRESAGRVPCETLRPDVDFAYLRGTAKKRERARARA